MSVFCGPYKLYKKSVSAAGAFESVISICVLEDHRVSERFYKGGNLVNTELRKRANLASAIDDLIERLEFLTTKENYTSVDVLDTLAL